MIASIIAKSYAMTEIAGWGVCFVGEGKRFFDGIKKSFTLPYTDCRLEPIVSFLTTNRIIRRSLLVRASGCISSPRYI